MGQIKVFVQELGLKTSISAERNLDLLTLAGSGTHKFWSVATFDTTPQKFGEFRSKWAMGMSGSFKIVPTQASYIFSTSGPQKTKKRVLFAFRPITPMQKFLRGIQGMPSESWRPGLSENVVVFVAIIFWTRIMAGWSWVKFQRKKIVEWTRSKKRHGYNFAFQASILNQCLPNRYVLMLIQWQNLKRKIVAVSFFCTVSYFCCHC